MTTFNTELPSIFEGIWPSLIVSIGALITLTILFFVVSHFAYFPVKEYMAKRKKHIQDNIDQATSLNKDAQKNFHASEQEIVKAKSFSDQLIEQSKTIAEQQKHEIIASAQEKSKKLLEQNTTDLKNQEKEMKAKLNEEFAQIAMQAAEKIIQENLTKEKNQKIIDDFIKQLENEK